MNLKMTNNGNGNETKHDTDDSFEIEIYQSPVQMMNDEFGLPKEMSKQCIPTNTRIVVTVKTLSSAQKS
jgi:hypothetical protein